MYFPFFPIIEVYEQSMYQDLLKGFLSLESIRRCTLSQTISIWSLGSLRDPATLLLSLQVNTTHKAKKQASEQGEVPRLKIWDIRQVLASYKSSNADLGSLQSQRVLSVSGLRVWLDAIPT